MSAVSANSAGSFTPVAARPAPVVTRGALGWLRRNLFGSGGSALATLTIVAALFYYVPGFIDWEVVNAVAEPDIAACRALDGTGACWGVIAEKYRLILFGRYPFDEQWRPLAATVIFVRCQRSRAIGRSIVPLFSRGLPCTSAT